MQWRKSFGLIQRIYASAALLVLCSFLIIGLVTFYHTRSENERTNRQFLLDKTKALSTALAFYLAEKEGDIYSFYTESFYTRLQQIAIVHQLHFEVFDLHGRWIISSQLNDFNYLTVPDSISSNELLQLDEAIDGFIYRREDTSSNKLVALGTLRNERGSPIAIVKIPYEVSNAQTRAEFSRFLQSLTISYVLFLPFALLLAFLLSKYITRSLRTVRQQLSETHLDTIDKPLHWKYNDEIGTLIEAYNEKLEELRKSAALLREKERESAWRDMARQVAHEIKNPLTPLQLSVQQLERAYLSKDPDFGGRLQRFSTLLQQQITTLSQIAESFSAYGQLPAPKPEKISLSKEITSVIHLFAKEERIQFGWHTSHSEASVIMDPDYLRRICNNLYKNAIQAIEGKGRIDTYITEDGNYWKIEIRDTGEGIPKERLERIFTPNFTTRSSGMGLGLSMVHNMVEQSNGEINVSSQVGEGTSFCISLPKSEA
ncbi:MAG: HAMP domain-containing histidine kinase [Flavobacteriales bacterium]|nr:HAMP domain-containing histidine kinase [Flavobacteriales bacterium]